MRWSYIVKPVMTLKQLRRIVLVGVVVVCAAFLSFVQAAEPTNPGQELIDYLDRTIDWYRRVSMFSQASVTPEELLLQQTVNESSGRAMALSFDFAEHEAQVLTSSGSGSTSAPAGSQGDRLAQLATAAVHRVSKIQSQIDQLDQQLQTTSATSRPTLEAWRHELKSELNLAQARQDVLQNLAGFAAAGSGGLAQEVERLRSTVPVAQFSEPSTATTQPSVAVAAATAAAAQPPVRISALGLWGLVEEMFTLSRKLSDVDDLIKQTDALHQSAEDLRKPIRTELTDAIHRGDQLQAQNVADNPAALAAKSQEFDKITARFRLLTGASVPLMETSTHLQTVDSTLQQWRQTIKAQYSRAIRYLMIRVGTMVGAILLLLIISQIWRRATFRYVSDIRRRRQFLLVRRLVVGGIVVFILIGGFITEFGSLATYAGLLTAGIAVALQSVILSGVAHLFFLGRYGVRVGDRVTISGITGDVIDIGIFRMYMMELDGKPNNLQPTGRIVVFSNSVLFQPNPFYKQIPGAEYNWHELGLTLSPDSDYHLAETRLMGAVKSVYDEYKGTIEEQHEQARNTLHVQLATPQIQGRFRFVDSGLEFVVRYPVEMRRAAEIDDKITRKLLDVIEQEPHLKLVSTSTPKIQAADGAPH